LLGLNKRTNGYSPASPSAEAVDVGWLRSLGAWWVALTFASLTMLTVVALLAWDIVPHVFPARAHPVLGAAPLALIAVALLIYQAARRPTRLDLVKALVAASAFLFWAANQLLPESSHATLFNDLAIALFVLDILLLVVGVPPALKRHPATEAIGPPGNAHPITSSNGTGEVHVIDSDR
jgi:hypothetical protein